MNLDVSLSFAPEYDRSSVSCQT